MRQDHPPDCIIIRRPTNAGIVAGTKRAASFSTPFFTLPPAPPKSNSFPHTWMPVLLYLPSARIAAAPLSSGYQ